MDPVLLLAGGLAALVVLLIAVPLAWRAARQPQRRIRRVLGQISHARIDHTLIPDGVDDQIYLEHLLLTGQGLLVIDVKYVHGVVFAGENMDEWAVLDGQRRHAFPNPLRPLRDRLTAVRALATDVPVDGRVVFAPGARFPHPPPDNVTTLDELRKEFRRAETREKTAVAAWYPQWKRLEAAGQPAVMR